MARRKAVRIIAYLCCALAAVSFVAYSQYLRAERGLMREQISYSHAFGELASALEDMDTALQKSAYATSTATASALCTELYAKAQTAATVLAVLPLENGEKENTAGFINRVGDYALWLSRAAPAQGGFSVEQRQALGSMSCTASGIAGSVADIGGRLSAGALSFERMDEDMQEAEAVAENSVPSCLGDCMLGMEKDFPETPSLIYDGQYSSHLDEASPRALEGLAEIDENAARSAAARFMLLPEGRVWVSGQSGGKTPCYLLTAELDGYEQTAAVSVAGGVTLMMLSSYMAGEPSMSAEECVTAAKDFLERRGYGDMSESYYSAEGGVLTVNFAAVQNGVVCYPDLIKLRVAMDGGAVVGFDASGYVSSHYERNLTEPTVDAQTALSALPDGLQVLSQRLAVIPTAGKNELLCHEFKCQSDSDAKCIIYVNAFTGRQEELLLLLEDENGTLTI